MVPAQDEGAPVTRLRGSAASAGQARFRGGVVTAALTAVAVLIGSSSTVLACPVCFGAEETSIIDGAKLGVAVLLGVTLAVQGGFVGFFSLSPQAREARRGHRARR
jgi:hypothetical protein